MNGHEARQVLACGCELGEGPLWHAADSRLYWCDILAGRLHWLDPASGESDWADFGRYISLAVPLEGGGMMVAGENRLERFEPATGQREALMDFEADNPLTRPNDGRVDRHGYLWLSSMGKAAEPGAGSLYRLHRGELVRLRSGITIPNAISFSPDGKRAYFADTARGMVFTWALDPQGWPLGEPVPWFDSAAREGAPDGAVVDSEGAMWLALWGAGKVVRLSPDARIIDEIRVPTSQPSCPAFGGGRLDRLYITTAREGMGEAQRQRELQAGDLFVAALKTPGLAEPLLRLG
ncbi:SMP-30/gluconolactonase/LRE family protein [Litchfieldella rifensis]|uniref:SMP-30/gluconolactonase/LRE family protein n=1 Tax=Litchfieldella rifensis TaxID=762643 RepID=A0ABV7LQ90_9GAMM